MLAKFKSHKIIEAGQIITVSNDHTWAVVRQKDGSALTFSFSSDLIARIAAAIKKPTSGDYFVVYDGEYQSWSPKKNFEEGYTELTD
jgi:hypothetical protein